MASIIRNFPRSILTTSRQQHRSSKCQALVSRSLIKARTISDMTRIYTDKVMKPVSPYSQAIKSPHAIYCSGQIHASQDGTPMTGTITEKTALIFQNLSHVLEEAGSSLEKGVKFNVYLTDMGDFKEMNEEYGKWVRHAPARSCVAVRELPMGATVEIECVALP